MTVNKNFVIRNGLEVNGDLIFADTDLNTVGIGSTIPNCKLSVDGDVCADNLNITGVITATTFEGVVNSTGLSTFSSVNVTNDVTVGGDLSVTGVSTFSSNVDINASIDIQNDTTIGGGLTVTGISTFASDLDINASVDIEDDLTVNGNLSVVGLSTFASDLDINASVDIQNDTTIGGGLTVTGVSTFASDLDINASVDVQSDVVIGGGLTVTGISTFASDLDVNASIDIEDDLTVNGNLSVVGLSTFASDLDINASVDIEDDLTVNGNLSVVGLSTFASDLDINASVDIQNDTSIGGGLTVTGVSTFASDLDINASVDIQNDTTIGGGLTVTGVSTFAANIDANGGIAANTLAVEDLTDNRVVIVGPSGELEDDANLTFDGTQLVVGAGLTVTGVSTFIDIDVNGTITASDSTGSSGQYLQSTGTGVTWASFPTNSVETVTQTATESQTTFTGLNYDVGYIDVYLNGVRLSPTEFTATNETDVVLDDSAFEGDTLDFVIFRRFERESNVFTSLTVNGGFSFGGEALENVNITAGTLLANQDINLANGMVHYFTTNETGISTANIRIDGSTSLDSRMDIGNTAAVTILITPNNVGYSTCINIDGSYNNVQWLNGTIPTTGTASGIDAYNYQIIKTGSATFTVLGAVNNFA